LKRKSGYYTIAMRTGRGGEYISNDILCLFTKHGIHKQFTRRYKKQQNGVVKRKNRTIKGMSRSMLKENKFPNDY